MFDSESKTLWQEEKKIWSEYKPVAQKRAQFKRSYNINTNPTPYAFPMVAHKLNNFILSTSSWASTLSQTEADGSYDNHERVIEPTDGGAAVCEEIKNKTAILECDGSCKYNEGTYGFTISDGTRCEENHISGFGRVPSAFGTVSSYRAEC